MAGGCALFRAVAPALEGALKGPNDPAALPLARCRADQRCLPSHGAAAALLRALQAACRLVEQLAPALHRASLQLLAQLAHSFFMPFCLTTTAALARIQVTLLQQSLAVSRCVSG